MECNKDEAVRAKDIGEKNMEGKNFSEARKYLLKAQQLCPATENISQMLSVCDVHCSSENKFGNEMDWYGILQLEQTADDTLIKKQYRKFALLLHPDKNKFAGAEAAFKLIGEAQRVLLDKAKRSVFDMKRRSSYKPVVLHKPPQQASRNVGVVRQAANSKETFWTLCLHCYGRFQYYKDVLGKAIRCQSCKKPYIAYDLNVSGSSATQPVFPQKGNPNEHANKVDSDAKNARPNFGAGFQTGLNVESSRSRGAKQPQKGFNLRKANGQKGKRLEESSESSDSDCSLDSEEVEIHAAKCPTSSHQFDSDGERQTRRSNRNKRHVSYKENGSDDEQVPIPSKKSKENGSTEEKTDASNVHGSASGDKSKKRECDIDGSPDLAGTTSKSFEFDEEIDSSLESTPNSTPVPTYQEYPDPEFSDFDKHKEEHCFRAGQVWAAYDTVDAMPRFYAKIKKVYPLGFKLQITWLESNPDDELGREWTNSDLPFSCGKFKIGITENTEDRLMFSHMVSGWKSIGRNSFMIYPKKGETWALFKNWDTKWCVAHQKKKKFDYEFVEVLSDYDEIVGILVGSLMKLKGFASLFCRISVNELQIRPAEVLRFSHMVPSHRMTGNERIDVPKDSFELDPASITMDLEEVTLPLSDRRQCVSGLPSAYARENSGVNVAGN